MVTGTLEGLVVAIVVTPLNLLGKQNKEALDAAGINVIAISRRNGFHFPWK